MKSATVVGTVILLSACAGGTATGKTTQEFVADAFACQDELGFAPAPVKVSTAIASGTNTKAVVAGPGVSDAQAAQINTCIARKS